MVRAAMLLRAPASPLSRTAAATSASDGATVGDGSRDGEAGQAAQGGQRDLDRAGQPAGRRLREPYAGRVLYLKEEQTSFSRNFPTHHPLIFFLRVGEGCIL